MKRIVTDEATTFENLLGERITIFGVNYIYTGILAVIDDKSIQLENPSIVYETGAFDEPDWKVVQRLPHPINIMLSAIESYGVVK